MGAGHVLAIGADAGAPSRYIDDATARLRVLSASFEDIQQSRMRAANRGDAFSTDALEVLEAQLGRQLARATRLHPLGPWLGELKGLGGPRVGRVLACIGDPRRFPGQPCTHGHYFPPGLFEPGAPCPVLAVERVDVRPECDTSAGALDNFPAAAKGLERARSFGGGNGEHRGTLEVEGESVSGAESCPGVLLAPRTTTGVRSVWHYAGLHVVEGKAARRRKGVQSDWSPLLRTLCIGPKGLADQIVLHRTDPYRAIYDDTKERKAVTCERLIEAHKIARTVAVKAFLGDLLTEWKRVSAHAEELSE